MKMTINEYLAGGKTSEERKFRARIVRMKIANGEMPKTIVTEQAGCRSIRTEMEFTDEECQYPPIARKTRREKMKEFFSHLKGLRKAIFWDSLGILASIITYLVAYNLTDNIFAATATFILTTIVTFFVATAIVAVAISAFIAVATVLMAITANSVFISSAAFVVTVIFSVMFAAATVVSASFFACYYHKKRNTTYHKLFILILLQAIIFGFIVLYVPAMIGLGVVYAFVILYFLFIDRKVIAYLKANPPKHEVVKVSIGNDPYRRGNVTSTLSSKGFYPWLHKILSPPEEEKVTASK